MEELTRAVLVGICTANDLPEAVDKSLEELERLLETAGGSCFAKVVQNLQKPNAATLIGAGKVAEVAALCNWNEIKLVVFDSELSPSQIRNLEDAIGNDVRVLDRSMLILDIFALHAVSKEGKLQVELAQLQYSAPRLYGQGKDLSRLGGGIGTRGPGESKLESDKRHIRRRITALEEELEVLDKNRRTMRQSRDRSGIFKVAIVGYTNAGKSTLLNRLTDAGILAEDKLFATLDPTTRKYTLPSGETLLLTDTVGFIRNLPHHLIKAFKSTLDEVVYADALLVVLDASDPECRAQLEVTEGLLADLGAADKPTLYVFNKCDLGMAQLLSPGRLAEREHTVFLSAKTGQGIELLENALAELCQNGKKRVAFHLPQNEGSALNLLYRQAIVETVEYESDGMLVTAIVDAKTRGQLRAFDPTYPKDEED